MSAKKDQDFLRGWLDDGAWISAPEVGEAVRAASLSGSLNEALLLKHLREIARTRTDV